MTTTADPAGTARPRTPTLDRPALMTLASTEYERFSDLLADLGPDDWSQPTDCTGWDVRTMAGHCLGMAKMAASVRENYRQMKIARSRAGVFIDALTALQVEDHLGLSPEQVVEEFRVVGPRAARGRRRTPRFVRSRRLPIEQRVDGQAEAWTIGYLVDTVLTRDPWMHRVDITRATGRPMRLTADHDGVLVADVVGEWAGRHEEPYELRLSGPAGGHWSRGTDGRQIELDAVEFCRALAGRATGYDLFISEVPF